MTNKTICRDDGRCEYAMQTGAEKEGNYPAGACAMPCDNSAAHLTIPGALEWDGDNGTHGVVGTHSADGEHSESAAAIATLKALGYTHNGGTHWKPPIGQKPDFDLIDSLRAQLDNTEQSRRSFFHLSQGLEKRLAERDALLAKIREKLGEDWLDRYAGLDETREEIDIALSDIADPAKCEACGDWGHIETEDSAHDCPECGPSVIERAVEAGVMNEDEYLRRKKSGLITFDKKRTRLSELNPEIQAAMFGSSSKPATPKAAGCMNELNRMLAVSPEAVDDIPDFTPGSGNKAKRRIAALEKAKICIECDQPYCHGVCVERGDQDYDRDQAAKGGEQ